MLHTDAFVVFLTICSLVALPIPLGFYLARVVMNRRSLLEPVFSGIERIVYAVGGIDVNRGLGWKQNAVAMLSINCVWFLLAMAVLTNMSWLPLNPDGVASMSADLAFNTAISFISNTNLQHYSGESGMSYFGQLVLMLFQFISAGTGLSVVYLVIMSLRDEGSDFIANFYVLLTRMVIRVLLPLSIVVAGVLVLSGVPMTFDGKERVISLEGDTTLVSQGPVAAFVAIKQLGTNGGGFYGANSAHPLENPTALTNVVECVSIALLSIAVIWSLGPLTGRRHFSTMVLSVMGLCFITLFAVAWWSESHSVQHSKEMMLLVNEANLEGKETRFGPGTSALWATLTTCTSSGSVNCMHDSLMPLAGLTTLVGMMVNCVFGGVGVGFLNFYVFVILAVFMSGLMVGRTPELFGKKIEAREMKIAMLIALMHPLLILGATAMASHLYAGDPQNYASWLHNSSYHGFSEMLYEFSSSAANNGSGFEGLGDNTIFWNLSCGLVMLLSRYLPIIGPLAIAGILAQKKSVPPSSGTMPIASFDFAVVVLAVILIVAALSFFPALALGPIAEHLQLH